MWEALGAPTVSLSTSPGQATPGATVNGRYRIIGEVGRGGMGVVYKAQDTRLERTVALKFLASPSTLGEESRERFIHEAQAISELDHPNICTVHEFDQTEAGEMYIVMAFYGGESLRDKIKRGPVAVEDVIDTAIQVARGLEKAHRKGSSSPGHQTCQPPDHRGWHGQDSRFRTGKVGG